MMTGLTEAELAEAIGNDQWLLTCPDVELPEAELERIRKDLAELEAEQGRRAALTATTTEGATVKTPLTTIAPDADQGFADWSDLDIERAVRARWGEDSDAYRALRAEQRRRDGVHDRRANAQTIVP